MKYSAQRVWVAPTTFTRKSATSGIDILCKVWRSRSRPVSKYLPKNLRSITHQPLNMWSNLKRYNRAASVTMKVRHLTSQSTIKNTTKGMKERKAGHLAHQRKSGWVKVLRKPGDHETPHTSPKLNSKFNIQTPLPVSASSRCSKRTLVCVVRPRACVVDLQEGTGTLTMTNSPSQSISRRQHRLWKLH